MDPELTALIEAEQYSVPAASKDQAMATGLERLTRFHRDHCQPYDRMLNATGTTYRGGPIETVPYLPAQLFKSLELRSVPENDVFRVMTSSGTTGQVPSRVFLDVTTARLQTRALSSIGTHYLGPRRLPMIIVDHAGVLRDRRFTARTVGVLGMMNFGRDHLFLLGEQMQVDLRKLQSWLASHRGEDLLIFGFTSMIWQGLVERLQGSGTDLSRATLVHSGGWKKLADQAVTKIAFKRRLQQELGISRVHDFYGMVEQVGSVYFECPSGSFHAPNFADVIIRDPVTWQAVEHGQSGVVEVVSLLPRSYPGHALLTEDLGVIRGVDDCTCGAKGRWFDILGRIPTSEIRGCSDTQVSH